MPKVKDVFLIWSGDGWIAENIKGLLQKQGTTVFTTNVSLQDRGVVLSVLKTIKPTHVINCEGCSDRYNTVPTIGNNGPIPDAALGALRLADCCKYLDIHLTVFASGSIFTYDQKHPINGPGFIEDDESNFSASAESLVKSQVEEAMNLYLDKVLVLRIRRPVSNDCHPRNFVTKLTKYECIVDIPNSYTVLSSMLPAAIFLAEHHETGIFNFTNPGAISHTEILKLYKKHVWHAFDWVNITNPEYINLINAKRSNCKLDTSKLEAKLKAYHFQLPEVHEAFEKCFKRMAATGVKINKPHDFKPLRLQKLRKAWDFCEHVCPPDSYQTSLDRMARSSSWDLDKQLSKDSTEAHFRRHERLRLTQTQVYEVDMQDISDDEHDDIPPAQNRVRWADEVSTTTASSKRVSWATEVEVHVLEATEPSVMSTLKNHLHKSMGRLFKAGRRSLPAGMQQVKYTCSCGHISTDVVYVNPNTNKRSGDPFVCRHERWIETRACTNGILEEVVENLKNSYITSKIVLHNAVGQLGQLSLKS